MSATYDPTLPTDRDLARFELGDVEVVPVEAALYTDAAISAVLTRYGVSLGIAKLADGLVVRFAQSPTSVGLSQQGISVSWGERIAAWRALASRMRSAATSADLPGMSGGSAANSGDVATEVIF